MPAPHSRDRVHRPFIYASINSGSGRLGGREASEFRHEDITGDRAHCGVCPRRRQRFGGYEQGVQVWSPSLVCPNPNSHQSRNVDLRVASTPRDVHKRNEPRRGGNRSPFPLRIVPQGGDKVPQPRP